MLKKYATDHPAAILDINRLMVGSVFYGINPWSFVHKSSEELIESAEQTGHQQQTMVMNAEKQ